MLVSGRTVNFRDFMFGLCSGLLFVCLIFPPPTDGQGDGSDVLRVDAKQDDDVILPCDSGSKQNLERKRFDWRKVHQKGENQSVFVYEAGFHSNNDFRKQDEQFKGRVSHFPDQLKNGDASIMIRKTRLTDNGRYICTFPQFQPIREVHIDLFVDVTLKDRTGEMSGAAPRPDVKLSHSKDKLQCDVKGVSPEPKVEWWDDAGNVLPAEEPRATERGGSYSVTLTININTHPSVNQFLCVVTQREIGHQIHTEFNVVLRGTKETSYVIVIGVLSFVLLMLLVSCGVMMHRKRKKKMFDGFLEHVTCGERTDQGDDEQTQAGESPGGTPKESLGGSFEERPGDSSERIQTETQHCDPGIRSGIFLRFVNRWNRNQHGLHGDETFEHKMILQT